MKLIYKRQQRKTVSTLRSNKRPQILHNRNDDLAPISSNPYFSLKEDRSRRNSGGVNTFYHKSFIHKANNNITITESSLPSIINCTTVGTDI